MSVPPCAFNVPFASNSPIDVRCGGTSKVPQHQKVYFCIIYQKRHNGCMVNNMEVEGSCLDVCALLCTDALTDATPTVLLQQSRKKSVKN